MGRVHSSAAKESRSQRELSGSFSVELTAARPLTDRQEASTIELSSSQRCSSLDSLSTNTSEGAIDTGPLSHYNPQTYQDAGALSIAQCAHGSSELVSGNKGTFVLSHYTEYHVSDQTLVVDVETRSSKASVFVSSRLSHLPGLAAEAISSSSGYSAARLARAAGPPPLEHLPNYCTLDADLNSSSNNSTQSLPPPLVCPSGEGGDNSPASSVDLPVTAASGPDPLVCIPSPLQLIPFTSPPLLKLEPLSGSPSTQLHCDANLWKPPCSVNTTHSMPAASGASCRVRVSSPSSPPPLAHPPVSLHATAASVPLFPPPTSIVLYGPPQGMPIITSISVSWFFVLIVVLLCCYR